MRKRVGWSALLLAAGLCRVAHGESHEQCVPVFAERTGEGNGWLGADAAFSVPLEAGKSLWIFGDTLLGPVRTIRQGEPVMTHNSLGLSRCDEHAGWSIRYAIPQDAHGHARSVFVPEAPDHWYWPMDGFVSGKLWVVLLCVRQPVPPRPGAFNFESCGVDLASFALGANLASAKPGIQPLIPAGVGASMSSTAVVDGDFVYFFGVRERNDRPLLLSRVWLSRLSNAARSLETLDDDGQWRPGAPTQKAKTIMHPGATEMSVRYHPEWHRWLAIYKDPELSRDDVLLRSAAVLRGPWTDASTLFHIGAVDAAALRPGNFCYAAKEHPEFAARGELAITYVCNASDPVQLTRQKDVYLPQMVRVSLDKWMRVQQVWRLEPATQDRSARSPGQRAGALK